MRHGNGFVVFLPWHDADNNRVHSRFTFKGDVDHRRVRRALRNAMRSIGIRAPKWWLNHYIKHRSYEPDGSA